MNLLTIENLTKVFTEKKVFDGANFSLNAQEKVGVIGINGTGKSTLLRIAAGLEEPDEGKVTRGKQAVVRILQQNPVFRQEDTVLEAVLEGNRTERNKWTVESEAKAMLNMLKITNFEQKMGELSGGQKKRAALVQTLLDPAEILILDEPTNHLDNEMSEWLEGFLSGYRGAVLMVTHDRYFLDRVSDRIVEIDKGKIYSYPGNYSEFVRLKEARQNIEIASERKRQSILRTELAWLARGARARSTKQKAHIERIEELKGRQAPVQDAVVEMNSISTRMGKKTIELKGICKAYKDKILVKDFSYIFLKGERIGIIGENGCGKSTLLKMIVGKEVPDAGEVEIGQTVSIGYFSQESEELDQECKVIDYVKEAGEYVETTEGVITASQMLERFLFDKTAQWNRIGKLSGGEKRRLHLLRVLMKAPNVLILDEPTNDLDIQTLTILEDYLDCFDGIVIVVSHDRYFLDRIVGRIFAYEEQGHLQQYEGNYSDYLLAAKARRAAGEQTPDRAMKREKTGKVKQKKLKFTYKEEQEFAVIEDEIEKLEQALERIEEQMQEAASSYSRLGGLMEEKEQTESLLEEKIERWEYLNDLALRIQQERTEK